MLKTTTKITSLIVTAASIVSMVPAMAADVKKVESIEGTVYQAKAEPGSTYIDAELNGEDEAVYVYKDGKYTKLDGAETGDKFGDIFTYDGKTYLQMADGDYYVDVANGERIDDDIKGSIDDDADIVLKRAIKSDNDGRFTESNYDGIVLEAETDHGTSKTLYGGATCRRYNYVLDKPFVYDGSYTKNISAIYADDKGSYVDADYNLGKIGVYNTTGAGVTFKNTDDTYKLSVNGTDYEIKAEIQHLDSFAVDSKYITRTAALSIWGTTDGTTYTNLTDDVYFGSASNNHKQVTATYTDAQGNTVDCTSVRVMQRISNAQASDKIDGIKYAKDVKTYFITDDEGKAQPLLGFSENDNAESDSAGFGWITGGASGYIISQYHDIANKRQYAETVNFKSEKGYNYTDIGDADSVDVAYVDGNDISTYAYAIGCGDHYVLSDDGYIEEFIGKDSSWEKLYRVDGGMNEISISLPMFAAVWNEDHGVYSIITPEASAADATSTTGVTITAGWAKATDGTWSFVKDDGIKATGWYLDGTIWYYLNAAGIMQTGWVNENGTWYYCNGSGAMLANTTVDGYVLGVSGAWVK